MTISPAANDLPAILHEGDVALGLLDTTYSPMVMEFCGELGLDFVWLDLEHGGPDPWHASSLEHLLLAAERTGIDPLLRLPGTDPTLVRKALDMVSETCFSPASRAPRRSDGRSARPGSGTTAGRVTAASGPRGPAAGGSPRTTWSGRTKGRSSARP